MMVSLRTRYQSFYISNHKFLPLLITTTVSACFPINSLSLSKLKYSSKLVMMFHHRICNLVLWPLRLTQVLWFTFLITNCTSLYIVVQQVYLDFTLFTAAWVTDHLSVLVAPHKTECQSMGKQRNYFVIISSFSNFTCSLL